MLFSPAWVIKKKRDGIKLSDSEINEFILGLQSGKVSDYQATAFLMAVFFQGMTLDETVSLTRAMLNSGDRYDLSDIAGPPEHIVDKHSTGGVGDKVSLILAPLAAACGLKIPMMSGRGLGHSGGTLDKLESIPGFQVNLDLNQFKKGLNSVGCAMIGQSESIAPADRKLYALRDVTATVECLPLITASILSKKLAEGTHGLLLDIKVGNGAFMKRLQQAKHLTKTITQVAKKMGLKCRALITNMDQPLGYTVGNAIEILECVNILRNEKKDPFVSTDLRELTLLQCSHMLVMGKICKTLGEARKLATERLNDGSAWRAMEKLCLEQNGDLKKLLDHFGGNGLHPFQNSLYPTRLESWKAKKDGIITKIQTENIGNILVELGGGRKKTSDKIHMGAGLLFHKKLGAKVKAGETIADVFIPITNASDGSTEGQLVSTSSKEIHDFFQASITIERTRKPLPSLVSATIT